MKIQYDKSPYFSETIQGNEITFKSADTFWSRYNPFSLSAKVRMWIHITLLRIKGLIK